MPQFEAAFLPEFKIKGTAAEAEFDFVDVISKGAYGQVYKVRSRNGGEIFALKVLSKAQIIAEDAVDRVKDEVLAFDLLLFNLRHIFILYTWVEWLMFTKTHRVFIYVAGPDTTSCRTSSVRCERFPSLAGQKETLRRYDAAVRFESILGMR